MWNFMSKLRNITPAEEAAVRKGIDAEILPRLEALRKKLGPQRGAVALQIIRSTMAHIKAQVQVQGFQKEEAAMLTETFGHMMIFSAQEIRKLLKNRETN